MATGTFPRHVQPRTIGKKPRSNTIRYLISFVVFIIIIVPLTMFVLQLAGVGNLGTAGEDLSGTAMDTSEASQNVSTIIPIYFVDVVSDNDRDLISDDDLRDTLLRTNAIFVRSKTDFKFDLNVQRKTLTLTSSSLTAEDSTRIAFVSKLGMMLQSEFNQTGSNVLVFSITVGGNGGSVRTKGFAN